MSMPSLRNQDPIDKVALEIFNAARPSTAIRIALFTSQVLRGVGYGLLGVTGAEAGHSGDLSPGLATASIGTLALGVAIDVVATGREDRRSISAIGDIVRDRLQ